MIGEVVGNYRVTAKLAEGGMGTVYRAEHPLLGKTAAVKVLLPELSSNREFVDRFFTEARSATAVRHPGIVEIYDFGYLASGAAYIVMEMLDGQPLSTVLVARGRLTEQEALTYTRGIASALASAHAQGIVHRDLKPDNIFLVRDPDMVGGVRPKILDFGIAKVTEAQRVGSASVKTRTGTVLGTPTYMSPEQCRGVGDIDHRSDLYAVGCILYEMLVGRPPFSSEGIGELLAMHQFMAPPPPSQAGVVVSSAAEGLVLQLLQKRPEDRVQSAADLARLLGHGSLPAISNPGAPTVAGVVMTTPAGVVMTTPPPLLPTPAPARITGGAAPIRITGGAPAVNAPTTLSAAAGAGSTGVGLPAAPKRSSRGLLFAGLGVVLAAGAAVAIVASGGGTSSPSPSQAAASPPLPPPPPPPALIDAGAPIVTSPPPPPPPVDVAAAPPAPPAAPTETAPPAGAAIATPTVPTKRTPTSRGNKHHGSSTRSSGSPSVDRGD